MEFQVLGPLRVMLNGQEVYLRSAYKPRLLLAALLSRADQPVPVDWLTSAVWGDAPPASAQQNIQQYIQHLRSVLGRDRVLSRRGFYTIVTAGGLDAGRFQDLANEGGACIDNGDAAGASRKLRAALALWRGPAFSEFVECPTLGSDAAYLEQRRLTTCEQWAQAELDLGRHAAIVATLARLVDDNPFAENLAGLLMLALFRSGRQVEALAVYRDARIRLADQLGIEPGRPLQELQAAILRSDKAILTATSANWSLPIAAPRQLPADVPDFTGRQEALGQLDAMLMTARRDRVLDTVVIAVITGTGGVGKTALAVKWAHRVAHRFPDGQLYLDLMGYSRGTPMRPGEALTSLLCSMGIAIDQVPADPVAAAARYRSVLADRRMLILLDNVRSADDVRLLLPGSPGCLVLVTSRDRLSGLVAYDRARRLVLGVLCESESRQLLASALGEQRLQAEPAAVDRLVHLTSGLPLALRLVAARLLDRPMDSIGAHVAELTRAAPAATLTVEGDPAIATAFDVSMRTLPPTARLVLRRLGLIALPNFTTQIASVLAGISRPDAEKAMDRLVSASLVQATQGARYVLLDLIRGYAASLTDTADEPVARERAITRLYDWYVAAATRAARLAHPQQVRLPAATNIPILDDGQPDGPREALAWLDAEHRNLSAAMVHAGRHGPHHAAWRLADALLTYLSQHRHLTDRLPAARAAVASARRHGDAAAQAAAYRALAHACFGLSGNARSLTYLNKAASLCVDAQWHAGEAAITADLAMMLILDGQLEPAAERARASRLKYAQIGDVDGQMRAVNLQVSICRHRGDLQAGLALVVEAETLIDERLPVNLNGAMIAKGVIRHLLGDCREANRYIGEALRLYRRRHDHTGESSALLRLAEIRAEDERYEAAREHANASLMLANNLGNSWLIADGLTVLAHVDLKTGNHQLSLRRLNDALQMSRRIAFRAMIGHIELGIAETYLSAGEARSAVTHAESALALSTAAGYQIQQGRALNLLATAHLRAGDHAVADLARQALCLHQRTGYHRGQTESRAILDAAGRR